MIYVIHWFVNIVTLGLVSIATITTTTYHVDEPINELNNLSLNDVFLDGNLIQNHDFSDGITNWGCNRCSLSVNNEILNVSGNLTNTFYQTFQYLNTTANNDYYLRIDVNNVINVNSLRFQVQDSNGSYDYYSTTLLTDNSLIFSRSVSLTRILFTTLYDNTSASSYDIDNIYMIDLTDLGIDNLTKNQLDDWYDIYVKANENNGVYIESSSHLNNNIHLVDVSVMVISFGFWVWLFKFLKGVIF